MTSHIPLYPLPKAHPFKPTTPSPPTASSIIQNISILLTTLKPFTIPTWLTCHMSPGFASHHSSSKPRPQHRSAMAHSIWFTRYLRVPWTTEPWEQAVSCENSREMSGTLEHRFYHLRASNGLSWWEALSHVETGSLSHAHLGSNR